MSHFFSVSAADVSHIRDGQATPTTSDRSAHPHLAEQHGYMAHNLCLGIRGHAAYYKAHGAS